MIQNFICTALLTVLLYQHDTIGAQTLHKNLKDWLSLKKLLR